MRKGQLQNVPWHFLEGFLGVASMAAEQDKGKLL